MITEDEARAWLHRNSSDTDMGLQARLVRERDAGVPRIAPAPGKMWGPDEYADWTHDDLVWRLVFLQCCLREAYR